MAVAKPIQRLTEAEYLEIERRAEYKSEFLDGEMFAMSGGTRWHSIIAVNITSEFSKQLKGSPCMAYNTDLRVKVQAAGLYTYPDLSVACGDQQFEDEQVDVLLNPTVLAEILSESSESYDRGKKFALYRQIPSLREYLLVSQDKPQIEQFIRQAGGEWLLRDVVGMDGKLTLPSLNITVALAEVYANVQFPPASEKPPGA
ncbi:MAG: Uma2 family endonuclease [Verrucomicrobiota bacterium]|jgi:Uma2 family endonuclease